MTLPFTLPDWLPVWAFLLLALPVLLYVLLFLLMPFSVFGVKARLEGLEAQVDALHEDVRNLSLRGTLMEVPARVEQDYDALPQFNRLKSARQAAAGPVAAPVPPAPVLPPGRSQTGRVATRPLRSEPRLD